MSLKKLTTNLILFCMALPVLADLRMSTIDGNAFLEEQSDHSGIKVLFHSNSPSATTDSVYTDAAGYYAIGLTDGIYSVEFSLPGYITHSSASVTFSGSSETFSNVTLAAGQVIDVYSDTVSGVWASGSLYRVHGDLLVDSNDTLVIEPGVRVKFMGYYQLEVRGYLHAVGAPGDSIYFESGQSNVSGTDWRGLNFVNGYYRGLIQYCSIKHAASTTNWTGAAVKLSNYYGDTDTLDYVVSILNSSISENGENCIFSQNSSIQIDSCHFSNWGERAVNLNNSSASYRSNCNISNNIIDGGISSNYGVQLNSSNNNQINFRGNLIFGCSQSPIIIDGNSTHLVIENNKISGGYFGINMGGFPIIRNNLFSLSDYGLYITSNVGGVIENNIFSECYKELYFDGINSTTIRYNDFYSASPSNHIQNPQFAPDGLGELITVNAIGDSVDTHFNIYQDPRFAPADTSRSVQWSLVDSILTMTLFPHNLWDFEDDNIGQKRLTLSSEPEYYAHLYSDDEGYNWSFNPYTVFNGVLPQTYYFAITDGPQEPYYTQAAPLNLTKISDTLYAHYGSRLTQNSPCIDAGNPDPQFYDADGTIADIGPHPFLQDVNGPIPAPVADFYSNNQSGTTPLFVEFSSSSTGPVTGYSWNFGDGSISTTARPVHRYASAGNYSVSMTVTGPGGFSTEVKTDYITVSSPALPPIVNFNATPRIGTRPVEITFSSMVENTIDSLRWTFGDGATSVLPSPVHTYSDTGQFEVTLMAYNTHGADTLTRNNYITVMPEYNVAADFSATPQLGVAPQSVTFQNNSIGTLDSVIWYFGDGDSSSLMHPIHTYDFPGNYSVSCIAFGPLNQDTLVQEAFINILDNRPMIQDIVDVPNDQGGRLLLNWERSGFDGGFNSTISQYSVWQQYQDTWISMGNYMANQSESYTTIINTFSDSTAENPNWSYFKVEAHTSAPGVFYSSLIDSGFSVDNVPPQIPGQLLAVIEPGNVNLEWNCYEEPQFMFYNVYRNGELIGESSSKSYVDVNYDEHTPNFYSVSSVDEAGNESQNSSRLFVDVDDLTWWLNLELTAQNGLEDLYNFIGVADSASDGFDPEYEYLEPPTPPGNYVSLYISHPEWDNTLGDDYSQDIRPEIDLSDTMQVWSLHVKSSIQDTLSLAINLIDTPNLPFIVEGPIGSDKEFMYDNMIITWLAQADSIYVLSISVGDTMPPNLALENNFEGPQVLVSDSSYSFQWLAQDGNQIDSSWVFSSYDGGNSFAQIFESAGGPDSFEWIIPDTSLLNQVLLGVRVSDYAGNTTWAQSNQPLIIAGHHQEFMIDTGWHLWSSPISAFNPSIFDELEPDIAGYWNFYGYDANGYSMDTLIHSGQSYWLANMEADTVMIDGNPIVNPSYEISLQSGWHLLATPYLVPSVVQDLLFRKDSVELFYSEAIDSAWITQLYGYDGLGYVGVSAIEPWQGYWLGVSDSLMMTIPLTNSQVAPARDLISPSWAIQLMASSINSVDNLNVIGIDSLAQMGFDANFDALEPPASPNPEYVSVYVDHPEWDHVLGTRFTSDIRTNLSEDQFHEWNIVVESDEDIVNITWELSGFPEYYELGIAQDSLSVFEDMRTLELVEVAVPATVIVRVGAHVLETENKSNLPSDYALFPNYPNPFNPSTTIRYNLPENDHVSLIVYDVKGRAVATIIDFQQTAGYYNVEWSGINDAGIPLSAGLYLCRLQAGSYSQTIKMLYLK